MIHQINLDILLSHTAPFYKLNVSVLVCLPRIYLVLDHIKCTESHMTVFILLAVFPHHGHAF